MLECTNELSVLFPFCIVQKKNSFICVILQISCHELYLLSFLDVWSHAVSDFKLQLDGLTDATSVEDALKLL